MAELEAPLAVAAAVALLLAALVALLRRQTVSRSAGAFDCSVRRPGGPWSLGVARYRDDRIEWFPVFGLSTRPRARWGRGEMEVRGQRTPSPGEAAAVLPRTVVVSCTVAGAELDLAMAVDACTALTSWLESAPPSSRGLVT